VIGWADEQPNPTYTHPRVVIDVTHWDHADLFTLGLPPVYDGKPVVLHEESAVPKAAGATALPTRLPATGAGGASGAAPQHRASRLRATGSNSPPGEDRRG
jgi:hypothetical protein